MGRTIHDFSDGNGIEQLSANSDTSVVFSLANRYKRVSLMQTFYVHQDNSLSLTRLSLTIK